MTNAILVLNAGSSSVKFSAFDEGADLSLLVRGQIAGLLSTPHFTAHDAAGQKLDDQTWPENSSLTHDDAVEFLLDWQARRRNSITHVAAGHRVVHGGRRFVRPVRINDDILKELEDLVPLAPLHQPHNLAAIRALSKRTPTLPQIACFDTSFHRNQPRVARCFGIPRELTASGIERYGFHGVSYEYIASRLPQIDARAAAGRTIVAHLGNGASLCAMRGSISLATTMGFTPLDGLLMGTRSGALDPGVVLYLMRTRHMTPGEVEHLLTYESGLLGVSGSSGDMRTLLEAESTDSNAAEAIELFIYRITREIGSLAGALGGLDSIVFTGGIGENSPSIRARVCQAAAWIGVDFDPVTNNHGGPRISRDNSRVTVWVVPTDEERWIAQHTRNVLADTA